MSDEELGLDEELTVEERVAPEPEQRLGLVARARSRVAGLRPERISWAWVNWRNATIGLAALLVLWLIAANWGWMYVTLWLWPVAVPKIIVFLLVTALGGIVTWAVLRRKALREEAQE